MERTKRKTVIYHNKIRLNTPHAVQKLLARTLNLLMDEESCMPANKARVIGYLCNIMISSFDVTDFEERLTALETKNINGG